MGKTGKKQKNQRIQRSASYYLEDDERQTYPSNNAAPSSQSDPNLTLSDEESESDDKNDQNPSPDDDNSLPSKFSLYQQSVQVQIALNKTLNFISILLDFNGGIH